MPHCPDNPNQQWERADPFIRSRMTLNKVLDVASEYCVCDVATQSPLFCQILENCIHQACHSFELIIKLIYNLTSFTIS